MTEFSIRPARPSDRERVLAFCRQTWDFGDYIDRVWDRWLADPESDLLVAVDGQDSPIGLGHVRMVSADEAWLEGLRVDPEVRQRGIARAMTRAAVGAAERRGATTIRFATLATNTPMHRLAPQIGFMRQPGFTIWRAEALADRPTGFVESGDEAAQVAQFVAWQDSVRALDGVIAAGWSYARVSASLISRLLKQGSGRLYRWPDTGAPAAYAWIDQAEPEASLPVPWLATESAHLPEAARELRRLAAQLGHQAVEWRVPNGAEFAAAARAAGFEPRAETGFALYTYRHT